MCGHQEEGMKIKPNICIIGAGISGLTVGYQLAKAGIKPIIFEQESSVGGRMGSEIVDGFIIDKGAYTLPEFHKTTIDIIRELGLEDALIETPGTSSTFSHGKEYKIKIGSAMDFLKYKLLTLRDKKNMFNLFLHATSLGKALDLYNPTEKTFKLENESAAEYLLREYNKNILEKIAYPIFCEIFLGTPESNSKVAFLATIRNLTQFKIFNLKQGLGMLPDRLEKRLDVRLNSPVVKIRKTKEENSYLVEVRGKNNQSFIFDAIVFAIPAPIIPTLFEDIPPEFKNHLGEIQYTPSIVTAIALDQAYPKASFINSLLREDFDVLGTIVFDQHKGPDRVPPGKSLVTAILRDSASRKLFDATEEAICQEVVKEIDTLLPGISKKVIFSKVYRWKYGAVQLQPGTLYQKSLIRKAWEDQFQNLYLVSDDLYRSSIEVQIKTGIKVANKMIETFASRRKPV